MKQTFHVPDMHCPSCVMRLEGLEDELPGIRHIAASYRKQRLEVEYDETAVGEAQIVAAAEALGYALQPPK
ncbi:MAG: heavy-metal-associated domain-containing protein [Anaerolineae bacterium]|nr:heavy-metal-associated domain-containing protein [Anaerolineae bacterium]